MKKTTILKIRRILALAGVALIVLMYAATLVFAFIDRTQSKSWLTASLFTTFFVAFVLYALSFLLKLVKGDKDTDEQHKGQNTF